MKLSELFDNGEYVISGEVGPVKGAIPRDEDFVPPCVKEAEHLNGSVHAINVTDNQSAVMKLGSLAACIRLKAQGYEPIYQITCRDRNRIALQSEILTAFSLGIDNMLLLTGDHTNLGDHKQAKPVFDLDSVQLVKIAAELKNGRDMAGNPLLHKPDMFIGAVVNPNFQPLDLQLMKMGKKVDAGAEFFQTQAVYDDRCVDEFLEMAQAFDRPIQLGVVLLKSPQMGAYMNKNVSGISVPQDWIDEIGSVDKADRKKKAAEMMGRFIRKHKTKFQGVHIMPLGWTDVVPDILEQAEIKTNGAEALKVSA
jgi:5,10-methylenetetrahydrofolate reductase